METTIKNAEERMQKSVQAFQEELAGLRTGRASAAMFDKIRVEY